MVRFHVERLRLAPSTNDTVKSAIEAGEPEGFAVCAREQTAGYGRQGRRWISPEGGLYLSVLLRPDADTADLPSLSLAVGLAVRDALAFSVATGQARNISLKWPNDVVCFAFDETTDLCGVQSCLDTAEHFSKLAGINLLAHRGAVCVGIGVNVYPPTRPLEVAGKNLPIYLTELGFAQVCDRTDGIDDVLQAVLKELALRYGQWSSLGFSSQAEEYNSYLCLIGQRVNIVDEEKTSLAVGKVCGVDSRGCLVIEHSCGKRTSVSSGEAHVIFDEA